MLDFQFADHLSQVMPPSATNTGREVWFPNHNFQGKTLLVGDLQESGASAQGLHTWQNLYSESCILLEQQLKVRWVPSGHHKHHWMILFSSLYCSPEIWTPHAILPSLSGSSLWATQTAASGSLVSNKCEFMEADICLPGIKLVSHHAPSKQWDTTTTI